MCLINDPGEGNTVHDIFYVPLFDLFCLGNNIVVDYVLNFNEYILIFFDISVMHFCRLLLTI